MNKLLYLFVIVYNAEIRLNPLADKYYGYYRHQLSIPTQRLKPDIQNHKTC